MTLNLVFNAQYHQNELARFAMKTAEKLKLNMRFRLNINHCIASGTCNTIKLSLVAIPVNTSFCLIEINDLMV